MSSLLAAALLTFPAIASDPPGPEVGDGGGAVTDKPNQPDQPDLGNHHRSPQKPDAPTKRTDDPSRDGQPDLGESDLPMRNGDAPDISDGGGGPQEAVAPPDMADCNGDGRADVDELRFHPDQDQNGNGQPDSCDADIDGDGEVGTLDLVQIILNWGICDRGKDCPADVTGNGFVDAEDLIFIVLNWG